MKITVRPGSLAGKIAAIPSKTYAHRILICAALSDGKTEISGLYLSRDVLATINCLNALGVKTELDGDKCIVYPAEFLPEAKLDCEESGSTLRFLLPLVASMGVKAEFVGRGKLPTRPMRPLIDALTPCGGIFDRDLLPIRTGGAIKGEVFTIDGSLSSQYVTGMLFALAAMGGKKTLNIVGKEVSSSYIDVTIEVLRAFGVKVTRQKNVILVDAPERLLSPGKMTVEGDWSNASYFLTAGVVGGDPVTVTGLKYPSAQADSAIVDILRRMGAKMVVGDNEVTAYPSELCGTDIDVSDCPDSALILSVAAAHAEGETVFINTDRLKIKECDRQNAIVQNLQKCEINAKIEEDKIIVKGGKIARSDLSGFCDHRMIMSAAVLSLDEGGTIDDIDAVDKSYPTFFEDMKKLGGKYDLSI